MTKTLKKQLPKLRKYQLEDLKRWVANKYRGGWFWDPGLGKTFAGSFVIKRLLDLKKVHRVFVFGPKIAIPVWHGFLVKKMGIPEDIIFDYTKRKASEVFTDKHKIFLMNYNLIPPRKNKPRLKIKGGFDEDGNYITEAYQAPPVRKIRTFPTDVDLWIPDESHMLKGHSSNAYKFFLDYVKPGDKILALSGTPFPNREVSCFTQVNLVDPGALGKHITEFHVKYCNSKDKKLGMWYLKPEKLAEVDKKILKNFCFRKVTDHLDLPPHTDIKLRYEPNDKQLKFINTAYNKNIADTGEKAVLLSTRPVVGTMIQQALSGLVDMSVTEMYTGNKHDIICNLGTEAKYNALMDFMENFGNNKLLLWVNFNVTGDYLYQRLKKDGFKVDRFHRGDKKNMEERIKEFTDGDVQILMSHPQIVGIAVNYFTNINYMLWYELSHNWAHYHQAITRIHRDGQQNPTFSYALVGHRTDEVILKALKEKADVQERLSQDYLNLI